MKRIVQVAYGVSVVLMMGTVWLLLSLQTTPIGPVRSASAPQLSHDEYHELQEELADTVTIHGGEAAITILRQEMTAQPAVAAQCHPLLHVIGHAAYDRYGGFAQALQHQTELCDSGYIHGVIETQLGRDKEALLSLKAECSSKALSNFTSWQCFHGIGHGLMIVHDRDVSTSLKECDKMRDIDIESACGNGVLMEQFLVTSHAGRHRLVQNVDYNVCADQQTLYVAVCYNYAATAKLQSPGQTYTSVMLWCRTYAKQFEWACVYGVGAQALKDNAAQPERLLAICVSARLEMRKSCVNGMATTYVMNSGSSKGATEFCDKYLNRYQQQCKGAATSVANKLKI